MIYEFKLIGNPWCATGEESVYSRRLLNRLFGNLIQNNCDLKITCNLSERIDSFFFKLKNQFINQNVQSNKIFSISLNLFDKIRIINGEQYNTLTNLVKHAIFIGWPEGIQEESVYINSHEFKLRGNPFNYTSIDTIDVCVLYMHLLKTFKNQEIISLYCTTDISNKIHVQSNGRTSTSFYIDIHTLFFAIN